MSSPTYSFVVPIYNDADLAEDFCLEFRRVLSEYLNVDDISEAVELIFVNDGSVNNAMQVLRESANRHKFVKVFGFSRNFGQHIALSCGYRNAAGSYVGMLNVDMEDPPDQIPILIEAMLTGSYDIVYGLRIKRKSAWLDRVTSQLFNYVLNKLTGQNFPLNTATLRLMNRRFTDEYNRFSEKSRYLPGLEMWLGFNRGYVNITHRLRTRGRSSYNLRRRLAMAFDTIISFSDLPLRWVAIFGMMVAILGVLLNMFLIVQKLFLVNVQSGYTSTVSVIVLLSGVQILVLGMAGLYVGKILREVQNRPLYIVKDTINV